MIICHQPSHSFFVESGQCHNVCKLVGNNCSRRSVHKRGDHLCQQVSPYRPTMNAITVTALLFLCHILLFYLRRRANWLPKSTRAPLYGRSLVLSELCYTVVTDVIRVPLVKAITDIGLAELSLLQEYLVWERIKWRIFLSLFLFIHAK